MAATGGALWWQQAHPVTDPFSMSWNKQDRKASHDAYSVTWTDIGIGALIGIGLIAAPEVTVPAVVAGTAVSK